MFCWKSRKAESSAGFMWGSAAETWKRDREKKTE
jgi:hypothetical protein